jgi:hypothetical protein
MPRRRTLLAAEVRQALEASAAGDPAGPRLPPDALARLHGLTAMVEAMLDELATGKTLFGFEPTARALQDLTRRIEEAETPEQARSALQDLLGVLTDDKRWQ